jgi:hypothetical protein
MSLPRPQWPARDAASFEIPSMLQPSPKMQYLQKQKTWLLYTLLFAPNQLSLPYISEDHSRIPEINSWQRKFIYLS